MAWNPDLYLKFADHRLRPALDLLNRIDLEKPKHIYDLGCGAGNVTKFLHQRWPGAHITGVDNSPEMLDRAKEELPKADWRLQSIASWKPDHPADLIYSNAALQWLDDHEILFPALYESLGPGGVLAVQMPHNFAQPSHVQMRHAAEAGPWAETLTPLLRAEPVGQAQDYWKILAPYGAELDIWECEYLQVLQGEDAVLNWMMGTTLRPLLGALGTVEGEAFINGLRARLDKAYPRQPDGSTLFPFRRLFLLAHRAILKKP